MTKIAAYHTDTPEYPPTHRDVYHDHDDCRYGREIKTEHRRPGLGGRPRCDKCMELG